MRPEDIGVLCAAVLAATRIGAMAGPTPTQPSTGTPIQAAALSALETRMLAGIAYVAGSADPNQTLDLHLPVRPARADSFPGTDEKSSRWPVAMFVHGGVWALGVRDEFTQVGKALAARGILTAVLSYRLAPTAKHPAQIEDVASAVSWLATHVAEYGGDPQRIVLIGQSAGAHLVTLLALETRWLAAHRLEREPVGGVIAISGIYDLEEPFGDPGQDTGKDYVERVFGPRGPVWRQASPIRHLAPPRPDLPLLLVMAEHDYAGIRDQTLMMEAAMRTAGWHPRPVVDVADREHDELVSRIGTAGDPATAAIAGFVFSLR